MAQGSGNGPSCWDSSGSRATPIVTACDGIAGARQYIAALALSKRSNAHAWRHSGEASGGQQSPPLGLTAQANAGEMAPRRPTHNTSNAVKRRTYADSRMPRLQVNCSLCPASQSMLLTGREPHFTACNVDPFQPVHALTRVTAVSDAHHLTRTGSVARRLQLPNS